MNAADIVRLALGFLGGLALIPLAAVVVKLFRVEVEDEEAVLVTRFGKLAATLREPGWHWVIDRASPWVTTIPVSLRRDFRQFRDICVNDARGTTVVVDVWVEFRVEDPSKATFQVEDWDRSLRNVVSHAVIAILGNRDFKQILTDRTDLRELLQKDIAHETERWGLRIDAVHIMNVSLLPEISQQVFHTIAARLERAKADIDENGRQRVSLLEAETSARVAKLVAEAKGQYPASVGRAYEVLGAKPEVLAAYQELYELSQLRPHRTVAFQGFDESEGGGLRAVEAAMLAPALAEAAAQAPGAVTPIGAGPDMRLANHKHD